MGDWYRRSGSYLYLPLWVQPGAKHNEILGLHDDALKVKIKAPPVDGAANEALIMFLAQELKLPKSSFVLEKGGTSRRKVVALPFNEYVEEFLQRYKKL